MRKGALYVLIFFCLAATVSTIVLAVLYSNERKTSQRVAPNKLQKYLKATGVEHLQQNHQQSEHSFLHYMARLTGWDNELVDKKVRQNATMLQQTDFFSLYPYEVEGVDCFNPTYIECHDLYIIRSTSNSDQPNSRQAGYKYVDRGHFSVDIRLKDLSFKLKGKPYVMPTYLDATHSRPILEDLRYVGQHQATGKVFLTGTAIIGDFNQGFIRMSLIEYEPEEKALNVVFIFPSPRMSAEKNWLLHLHANDTEIVFDILYSFHEGIEHFLFHYDTFNMHRISNHPVTWPKPYHSDDTLIRGSALLALPPGVYEAGFLLLVHRRSPDYYYYYYAALLREDFSVVKVIQMPVFLERPFRITFIMNLYVKDQVLCVTAGIEDRISCILTYDFAEFMSLFEDHVLVSIVPSVSAPL